MKVLEGSGRFSRAVGAGARRGLLRLAAAPGGGLTKRAGPARTEAARRRCPPSPLGFAPPSQRPSINRPRARAPARPSSAYQSTARTPARAEGAGPRADTRAPLAGGGGRAWRCREVGAAPSPRGAAAAVSVGAGGGWEGAGVVAVGPPRPPRPPRRARGRRAAEAGRPVSPRAASRGSAGGG